MLTISLLDIIAFVIFNARKLKILRDHLFSNAVKVKLFISDVKYYVPLKLSRAAISTKLLKLTWNWLLSMKSWELESCK